MIPSCLQPRIEAYSALNEAIVSPPSIEAAAARAPTLNRSCLLRLKRAHSVSSNETFAQVSCTTRSCLLIPNPSRMRSNGEVEGPDDASGRTEVERSSPGAPDAAGLEPRADNLSQRSRRHYRVSRPPPTIVRAQSSALFTGPIEQTLTFAKKTTRSSLAKASRGFHRLR